MQDEVDRAIQLHRLGDIDQEEAEPAVAGQVLDVAAGAGDQVVERRHRVPFGQKAVTEMGSDKTRCPGDQKMQSTCSSAIIVTESAASVSDTFVVLMG